MEADLVWQPNAGPQEALVQCPVPLIFYGGARGGGKTQGALGKLAIHALKYPGSRNLFFRKEIKQTDELIEEAKKIYLPLGADLKITAKRFDFPEGSSVSFSGLERKEDAERFQGHGLSMVVVDEAGNYSDPAPIWLLFGAMRSGEGIPSQLILTGNPGGPGHYWLKKLFYDPYPLGMKVLDLELGIDTVKAVFIPAKLADNPKLLESDPSYVDRLRIVGSEALVSAWLHGDWSAIEGGYFSGCFSDRHIFEPFPIPHHWPKILGYDWGHHSPYHACWVAISTGADDEGKEVPYEKESLLCYREATGKGESNEEMAQRLLALSDEDHNLNVRVADPSIFNSQGGPSIAEQMSRAGLHFRAADNDRLSGWSQLRSRWMSKPSRLYISAACKELIQQIQAAPIDERRPEDLDTTCVDHGLDALRYACKTRLWSPEPEKPKMPLGAITFGEMRERHRRKMRGSRI